MPQPLILGPPSLPICNALGLDHPLDHPRSLPTVPLCPSCSLPTIPLSCPHCPPMLTFSGLCLPSQ